MRRFIRLLLVVALLLGASFVVGRGAPVEAQASGRNPIMGAPRVSAQQLAQWFRATTRQPYRASVPIEELTRLFIEEGIRYNVRGDIAFAQSILETLWFNYPDYGQVRPSDNNFAGIGACNSCSTGYNFPSARAGVRAQIQHLRNYADASSRSWNIPDPPLLRGFDTFFLKGRAPNWEDLNGKWAVPGTTYGQTILSIHNRMLAFHNIAPSCPPDAPAVQGNAGQGYWIATANGDVLRYGSVPEVGSLVNVRLNAPVIGLASSRSSNGFWMVAGDGGIFSFGDAAFFGSTGNMRLNAPVIGMAATPSGRGYWLVAADGGIFTFGDAPFFGSTGNMRLNAPVLGMAVTPSGRGYWLYAADGGIFSFGDAAFFGSTGNMRLNAPVKSMASLPSGGGYWLIAEDGGIFTFGRAPFLGSLGGCAVRNATSMVASASGAGYWIMTAEGRVTALGDARFHGYPTGGGVQAVGLAVRR